MNERREEIKVEEEQTVLAFLGLSLSAGLPRHSRRLKRSSRHPRGNLTY
jgi:hypothetical protein